MDPAHWLQTHEGAEVITVPVTTDGVIDLAFLQNLVSQRCSEIAVISIMHSNNETGVLQPINEVVRIAGNIPVHTDAVQSFKKSPLSFSQLGVIAMSLSAHKIGGPLGIGALILRRTIEIPALLHGGGQEREIRSGTLNAPSIVSFAAAAGDVYPVQEVKSLRDRFIAAIPTVVSDAYINGINSERLPGIVNVTFPGTQSDTLLLLLDSAGVSVSTGSACSAGVHRPISISFCRYYLMLLAEDGRRISNEANSSDERWG
jgi:cysteine desulfurase